MKFRVVLPVVVMLLSVMCFAQSDAQKAMAHDGQKPVVQSDAQKSFDTIKTLAGTWTAKVHLDPPMPGVNENDIPSEVKMRVTSRGNALVHEMYAAGLPDDPARYDHPLTMFYMDSDRLTLVHYCDAGNRPRMVARKSPDGKTLEFDFVDISGGTQRGHMQHAVFTIIDANHHTEDWTYLLPGDKPMRAHFDLQRAKTASGASGK